MKSIGTPLAAGEIYDSNRYTLYGMLTRVNCDVIDMGVIEDTPAAVERALANAYSEQQTSTIYTSTNEYWVLMQLVPKIAVAPRSSGASGTDGSVSIEACAMDRREISPLRSPRPSHERR